MPPKLQTALVTGESAIVANGNGLGWVLILFALILAHDKMREPCDD